MHNGNSVPKVSCRVLTLSDSRNLDTDESGALICTSLEKAGHTIENRFLIPDDPIALEGHLADFVRGCSADTLITTGGTGIALRDTTVEVVSKFLFKRMEGFGELFRFLSYDDVGAHAMLSRALAGITREGIVIFSLPGSKKAVSLGMEKLILPVLSHVVELARTMGH